MAKGFTYKNTDSITYTENTTVTEDLDRTGYLTQLDFLFKITVTPPASGDEPNEDAIARLIKGFRIYSGATTYFTIDDGRQWYYLNYFQYKGRMQATTVPSPGDDATTCYYLLRVHLGDRFYDRYDPLVPIPARELAELNVAITWGDAASDIGTGYSASGSVDITNHEIVLEPGETRADIWPNGILSPRVEPKTWDLGTQTYTNLSAENDVPVGDTLVYTGIIVLNSSGNKSDSDITEMGIKLPKTRTEPWKMDWVAVKAATGADFDAPLVTGATLFPWRWISGKGMGMDMSAMLPGDVKLRFTKPGTTDADILLLHYLVG